MEHRRPSEFAENSSFSLVNAGFPAATAAPPLLLGSPWTSQKRTWMFQGSALRRAQGQTTPEGGDKRGGSAATPQHCSPPNPGVARGAESYTLVNQLRVLHPSLPLSCLLFPPGTLQRRQNIPLSSLPASHRCCMTPCAGSESPLLLGKSGERSDLPFLPLMHCQNPPATQAVCSAALPSPPAGCRAARHCPASKVTRSNIYFYFFIIFFFSLSKQRSEPPPKFAFQFEFVLALEMNFWNTSWCVVKERAPSPRLHTRVYF